MQGSIFDAAQGIASVRDVLSGLMFVGQDPTRDVGRYSDCFVYVLTGKTQYCFEDGTITVEAGDVMYLARGSKYKMRVLEEYRHIFIDFDFEAKEFTAFKSEAVRAARSAEQFFQRALARWIKQSAARTLQCKGLLYEIYAQLMECGSAKYISPAARETIERAAREMAGRIAEPGMSLAGLARDMGMSPAHLRRLFHSAYGVSPARYVRQLRVQRAKRMLKESDKSISQVAEELGYPSVYYFSRVFKEEAGVAPSEYRRAGAV